MGPGSATVSMVVSKSMLNGAGIANGGVIFTLADFAFAVACNSYEELAVARAAEIEFLRPAHAGERLRASAVERRRIGRRGIYDVSVVSAGTGEAIAEFRGHCSGLRGHSAPDQE
jgi:acyl-CoA thioesterase